MFVKMRKSKSQGYKKIDKEMVATSFFVTNLHKKDCNTWRHAVSHLWDRSYPNHSDLECQWLHHRCSRDRSKTCIGKWQRPLPNRRRMATTSHRGGQEERAILSVCASDKSIDVPETRTRGVDDNHPCSSLSSSEGKIHFGHHSSAPWYKILF